MALTRPTIFANAVDQNVLERHWIARFVIGSASRMYGDVPMQIADALGSYIVEGRLTNGSELGTRESVNLHLCDFEETAMRIVIDNSIDAGTLIRPSDEWSTFWLNVMSGYVELYMVAGQPSSLSDCMLVFKGRVVAPPMHNASTMDFEVESYTRKVHRELPVLRASDLGATIQVDNGKRLPIAYGDFITESGNVGIYSADRWGNRVGRVRAIHVTGTRFRLHRGETNLGEFWIKKRNGQFIRIFAPTINSDSNGVYCDIGNGVDTVEGYVYHHPTGVESSPISYGAGSDLAKEYFITGAGIAHEFDDGSNEVTEAALAYDKDGSTKATLSAGVHFYKNNGADHDVMEKAQLVLSFPSIIHENGTPYTVVEALLVWKALLKTITGSPTVKYGTSDASDPWKATEVAFVTTAGYERDNATDIYDGNLQTLDISSLITDTDLAADDAQVQFLVYLSKELSGGADPGSYGELLDIYETHVRCKIVFLLEPEDELWYGGFTQEIDSSISGRAGNPASGSTNKYPGFIIEQELRTNLGVSGSDIDTAAFDALYASAMTMAVAVDREEIVDSMNLFKEIGENSNVMYYMNAVGQHTLVARKPTAPGSVDATIHRSELVSHPEVIETDLQYLVNDLVVNYDYDREANKFRKNTKLSDSSSQTQNGVRTQRPLSLRFTDTSVVDDGSSAFITCLKWLFHNSRAIVRVRLQGWERSHLEIGDWFSLDATSVDPIVKFRGSSWSGAKFFITGLVKTYDGVDIEGIYVT